MLQNRLSRALRQRLVFLVVANAILLLAIAVLLTEGASLGRVLVRAGPDVAPIVLAGLAMTGIVFVGAIDLSIASIVAMAGTIFGVLVYRGAPPWVCYAGCMGTAWLLSIANGQLIRSLKVSPIILTLGGLAFYRGLALIVADVAIPGFGGNLSVQDDAFHGPGKEWPGCLLFSALGVALLLELFGRAPRLWLALGNSEEACRLAGLNPGRILQSAFLAGGFFLGLAALVYVTRIQAIEPSRLALGFELQVIGAVILGGTNIFGGEGSYLGTVLGALMLYFTQELLIYAHISASLQEFIIGLVIVGVIGLDCALHRKRRLMEELK